jgi:DNA-binding NarL/FixJ family response regulator
MKRIVLADSHPLYRVGLASTLAAQKDVRIVAQCGEADRMMRVIERSPGCIVFAASSLLTNSVDVSRLLDSKSSRGIVIAENNEAADRFLQMKFHGVIFRDVSTPVLLECVQQVAAGKIWEPGDSAGSGVTPEDSEGDRVRARLTSKEMKIVSLLIQGYKNREIADQLKITEQVVKNYLRSIYDKTGAEGRQDLMLFTLSHKHLAKAVADVGVKMITEHNSLNSDPLRTTP